MKLSLAASALLLAANHQSTVQAACDSQLTIDVPAGVTGLTFVGYAVDDSKIVRSIGSVNQIILKNFSAEPIYTIDEATGVKVTAGDSCTSSDSDTITQGTTSGTSSDSDTSESASDTSESASDASESASDTFESASDTSGSSSDTSVQGSTSASIAFVGGLLTGSPLIAATSLLFAGLPFAFAEDQQDCALEDIEVEIITTPTAPTAKPPNGTNPCDGAAIDIAKQACIVDSVVKVLGQSGADVTVGYTGGLNTTWDPITTPLYQAGLCPVNVHWHLGAEHRSEGEYDETFDANGPETESSEGHRRTSGRMGFRCKHYDASDSKFTTPYEWQHCKDLLVGETYEVHWPHSTAGACGTVNQWQTPFYDGVFCNLDAETLGTLSEEDIKNNVGVQGQVFTIVNDEAYYYPDLMRGMIVDGEMGTEITYYTGSTTGDKVNNTLCSSYAPISWQVDRKCHLISASTFDKMCADMKAQRDDMTDDLEAHGSRELVDDALASNNQQGNRDLGRIVYSNFVY